MNEEVRIGKLSVTGRHIILFRDERGFLKLKYLNVDGVSDSTVDSEIRKISVLESHTPLEVEAASLSEG